MTSTGLGINNTEAIQTIGNRNLVSSTNGLCGITSLLLLLQFPELAKPSEELTKRDVLIDKFIDLGSVILRLIDTQV